MSGRDVEHPDLIPILIKVWAGSQRHDFRYIRRSLRSLMASDLPAEAWVILANDCSSNPRVEPFLQQCVEQCSHFELWTNPTRMGVNRAQEYNFVRMVKRYPDAPFYGNCDDDVIYHPGWLQRLLQVAREAREAGLNGVFTAMNSPFRPAASCRRLRTSEVLIKERQAALNWLVPRDVYDQVGPFRDRGVAFDSDYCDRMAALGLPVVCLKPSYVQNIGYCGAYQSSDAYTAQDYVGRRDLWLWSRDLWYRMRRSAFHCADTMRHHFPMLERARRRIKTLMSTKCMGPKVR